MSHRLWQIVGVAITQQLTDDKERAPEEFSAELIVDGFVKVLKIHHAKIGDTIAILVACYYCQATVATDRSLITAVQIAYDDRNKRLAGWFTFNFNKADAQVLTVQLHHFANTFLLLLANDVEVCVIFMNASAVGIITQPRLSKVVLND